MADEEDARKGRVLQAQELLDTLMVRDPATGKRARAYVFDVARGGYVATGALVRAQEAGNPEYSFLAKGEG
jgi:hypothetical protein